MDEQFGGLPENGLSRREFVTRAGAAAVIVDAPLTEPEVVRPFAYQTQAGGQPVTAYRHNT